MPIKSLLDHLIKLTNIYIDLHGRLIRNWVEKTNEDKFKMK